MGAESRFNARTPSWSRAWIGVLLVIVGGDWRAESQTPKLQWVGEKVWADDVSDHTGHISADARLLTFVNWAAGELSIRDLNAYTNRPLVRGLSFYGSVISPDGMHVAYNSDTGSGTELSIVTVGDGSVRTLDSGRYTSWVQGWTPDARELLVVNADGPDNMSVIGFVEVQTSRFTRVGSVYAGASARLSPDGSRIVVTELAEPSRTERDIKVIDVASGRSQSLLTGPTDDYSADWSPDGQAIYFLSDRENKARLWKLPFGQAALGPEALHDIPDGDDRIIGVTRAGRIFVGGYDIGGTNSYVAEVDWRTGAVRGIRQLPNPPLRGSRRAVLSPNAEQVAFLRRPRGFVVRPGWQIPVVQSFDGHRERVYPTALTIRDEPVWSADGRALLFTMPEVGTVGNAGDRPWRFVRLDLERGTFSEIGSTGAPGQVRIAGLMGDELFYLLHDFDKRIGVVMALNLKTGTRRELYKHSRTINDAVVAPDRQRIAFAAGEPGGKVGVFVVSLHAPDPQRITSLQSGGAQVMWFANGEAVVTNGRIDGQPGSGMWRISLKGDPPVRLQLDFDDVTEVRVSLDARRVAFTRRFQSQREVWEYRANQLGSRSDPAAPMVVP